MQPRELKQKKVAADRHPKEPEKLQNIVDAQETQAGGRLGRSKKVVQKHRVHLRDELVDKRNELQLHANKNLPADARSGGYPLAG